MLMDMREVYIVNNLKFPIYAGKNALIALITEHIDGLDPKEHFNLLNKEEEEEEKEEIRRKKIKNKNKKKKVK